MHKARSNKSEARHSAWGDWSDWVWSPEYNTFYRARQNTEGILDYEYHTGDGEGQAAPGDPSIDDITHGMNQLSSTSYSHVSRSAYDPNSEIPDGSSEEPEYSYMQSNHNVGQGAAVGVSKKGKEKALSHGNDGTEVDGAGHLATTSVGGDAFGWVPNLSAADTPVELDDSALEEALNISRGLNPQRAGESSSRGQGSAYALYDAEEDEDPPTPTQQLMNSGPGMLDPRYVIEPSSKFQPGKVFKVHWAERMGEIGEAPTISDKKTLYDQFGGKIFVGFRRFIVIANDEGNSTCVPILTYGGKACAKHGVKARKHGIIYAQGHRIKPKPLEKEPKLGFPPVKMKMDVGSEKLAKESRINYAKLVTVEHNVRVFFIGRIVPEDWDNVLNAVDKCWESKDRRPRK